MNRKFGLKAVIFTYIMYCVFIIKALNRPTFESNWRDISVNIGTIDIPHNLGVYPAKVDVQIRVTKEGVDYIFTGTGAAQRDNDLSLPYGGVVYIYDSEIVRIITPDRSSRYHQESNNGVAYTGSKQYYNGGPTIMATSGHVRVRLWTANDYPEPNFSKKISMDTTDKYKVFKEVSHGLGKYPDMVSVRIQLDDGFMSEGQGVVFHATPESWLSLSGVLYGYNNENVRVWIPHKLSEDSVGVGTVCCAYDGWSTNIAKTNGTVHIRAWLPDHTFHDFTIDTQEVNTTSGASPTLFPVMDFSNFYINVEVLTANGDNRAYKFCAAGSSMLATVDGAYGGLIYVYTNNSVMVWIPNAANKGHVQFVGGRWGNNAQDSTSNEGQLIVKVYTFRDFIDCEDPVTVANASFTMNGSKVTYTCHPGYTYETGNLTRTCRSNGTWNGYPPVCTAMQCHSPGGVANATYTLRGLSNGSTVTYACNTGYMYEAGFLTRTCQSDGTWDGVPPVCTGTCGLPPTYNFTIQSYTGVTSGSIAEFKCNFGYTFASGSIQQQCFPPNWIGNPVVCKDMLSNKEVTEMINKIEKELIVNKKTTSTFYRRKNCAEDPRPSSKQIVATIYALSKPSFVSNWYDVSVGNSSVDILHSLGVYPVKVDVQILVNENGVDYIFTGTGAAQRDDDNKYFYGGLVYIYNTDIVRIIVPDTTSSYAGIAFTGRVFIIYR
ncbi:CSMD [Mytilus coruscus]|uniref:CSMD n=1 Tax=Mytilus coruscus TaxID=42192 RepID=A0A6J8B3Z6_MYTCO|nr:CSMD [Mytilus coruscus]